MRSPYRFFRNALVIEMVVVVCLLLIGVIWMPQNEKNREFMGALIYLTLAAMLATAVGALIRKYNEFNEKKVQVLRSQLKTPPLSKG